ncbi:MAG: anti-sigma factor [Acidobacteriota bacterium]|nr:anti-sigma factor [Acidobacteriota bacterium]
MNCEELRQDYTAWALGILQDPERSEIAEHLARECPNCVPGVRSAMATVAVMSGAVEVKQPPPHLRRRVLASIEREPARWRFGALIPWAITAALSIALVSIGISGRRQIGETPNLQQALSILNDPSTKDVAFGETEKPSKGRVFVSFRKGVVFIGASLPNIDAGKTFELWVIPARGNPAPAGIFQSQPDATAVFVRPGPVENVAAIAVTIEPAGGSAQPTTKPFIVTKL